MAETGKQRAIRIPLDYYKRWDPIQRWKVGLAAIAGVLALAWWASGFVTKDKGQAKYERGLVAAVHAEKPGDDNCTACHVPFSPISAQRGPATLIGNIHTSDAKCEECHPGPGQKMMDHHTQQTGTTNCGGCHRDHLGRDVSLVRLADSDCTSCHKNLKDHMTGDPNFNPSVTRFDKEHHPEFHLFDKRNPNFGVDSGKLKFNHARHLAAGLDSGFTYGRLDAAARESGLPTPEAARYGDKGGDKSKLVQLDCKACHEPEKLDAGKKLLSAGPSLAQRMDGAYMVPITYENQCQVCHPLTDLLGNRIEHRLTPQQIDKKLREKYATMDFKAEPQTPTTVARRVPGDRITGAVETGANPLETQLRNAERYLYGGQSNCGECHYFERKSGELVPTAIVPTRVPERWFDHALFNHAKHTEVECLECHTQAKTSTVSKDVLIPDIDNCQKCHAPGTRDKAHTGRADCTECHRYHNPPAVSGARAGLGDWARARQ